jgi:hypothetical protein
MGEGPPRSSIVRAHYRLATVLRWRYSSLEREWGGGGTGASGPLFSLSKIASAGLLRLHHRPVISAHATLWALRQEPPPAPLNPQIRSSYNVIGRILEPRRPLQQCTGAS